MEITSENENAIFELLYKYWVDQESTENLEQEISYIDPKDLGYFDKNIEAISILRQVTETDPVLFQGTLAADWQRFVDNRLFGNV